jgi:hypothetical protein
VVNPRSWIVFPLENGLAWFRERSEEPDIPGEDKVVRAGYIDTKGQVVWQTSEWKVKY